MKPYLHLLLTLVLVAACAKHRDIERLNDPDGEHLSKELFTGTGTHWASKVTVVRTSTNGGFAFSGLQSDLKVGHFEFSKEKLKYLNDVNVYNTLSEASVPSLLNEWDVTHFDKKLAESDGRVTNKEEEDKEKAWDKKRYFTIDFAKANISEAATFPYYVDAAEASCWSKKAAYLVDGTLELSSDYVGFVVGVDYQQNSLCSEDLRRWAQGDFIYTVHYRYSFKKLEETGYKPYVYQGENDPLMKRFGYFQTVREVLNKETGLLQNVILMNRWNPDKTHHFFFTKDFPEGYKAVFADPEKGVFAKTNKMLSEAGLKTRFEIHDNTGLDGRVKEFGDLRYSFVNFVPEIDPGAPFGYGPSDANPFTGEIIAANLNVWTGYLKYYLKRIKDSFDREETKFENSSLFASLKATLGEKDPQKWVTDLNPKEGSGKILHELLPEMTFAYPGYARFTAQEKMPLMQLRSPERLPAFAQKEAALPALQGAEKNAKEALQRMYKEMGHVRNTTVYPLSPVLSDALQMSLEGLSDTDILETLIYRVAIHEFGHNLGLRHNFYGSVDAGHFAPPRPRLDKEGNPVMGENGEPLMVPSHTSSVMEYLSLEDEVGLVHDWEPYDKAALQYAYSSGAVSDETPYLFCTDEHRPTNALCNHWDNGATPSEVLLSMIKRYENNYFVVNYRNDRAYWNTSAYGSSVFSSMWDVKRFLLLWRAALSEDGLRRALENKGGLGQAEIETHTKKITADLKQAVRLSVAFYNAVIQQSSADRPYTDEVEPFTGETKRIGILYDKLYAMLFLMGDDSFVYNPNRPLSAASYLAYGSEAEIRDVLEQVYENTLTERVDMEPWFIGFARGLYSLAATNVYNMDDITLINKIKVVRCTRPELEAYFGLDAADLDTVSLRLDQSTHPYFQMGEEVGITRINDRFYVVSKFRNPYAYDIVESILEAIRFGNSTVTGKSDLLEMYKLYQEARGDEVR